MPLMYNPTFWSNLLALVAFVGCLQHGVVARDYAPPCPAYEHYAIQAHKPLSEGPLRFPSQRPSKECRTYHSSLVEKIIDDFNTKLVDPDLAKLFENAFPNTLDTTVKWHADKLATSQADYMQGYLFQNRNEKWEGPHSFIVTGDINAEWLRDSTNQLAQYQPLASKDERIFSLILGAINTQTEFVIMAPYCNAFQPPGPSGQDPRYQGQDDRVHPAVEPSKVFECKYELDSVASFLSLGNQFYNNTGSTKFLTQRWYLALDTVLSLLDEQSKPTFDQETHAFERNEYTWQRRTDQGTETLNLQGVGNPLAAGTGLVRSAFRPSDDATIFGFFIPANAMMAVELNRTAELMTKVGKDEYAKLLREKSASITQGIRDHAIVEHKKYGKVFAYEVDGYGSVLMMDDANLPSLLSLPLLGFLNVNDEVYQNTRKMILSQAGNPYYLRGMAMQGIGGPHIGLRNAWPMSLLVQVMTSDDDAEIKKLLEQVKSVSPLGLIHESINVHRKRDYTRTWFAWANSVFAQTILDLARRKPELLFGGGAEPYIIASNS